MDVVKGLRNCFNILDRLRFGDYMHTSSAVFRILGNISMSEMPSSTPLGKRRDFMYFLTKNPGFYYFAGYKNAKEDELRDKKVTRARKTTALLQPAETGIQLITRGGKICTAIIALIKQNTSYLELNQHLFSFRKKLCVIHYFIKKCYANRTVKQEIHSKRTLRTNYVKKKTNRNEYDKRVSFPLSSCFGLLYYCYTLVSDMITKCLPTIVHRTH
jgi:hypothetical protein